LSQNFAGLRNPGRRMQLRLPQPRQPPRLRLPIRTRSLRRSLPFRRTCRTETSRLRSRISQRSNRILSSSKDPAKFIIIITMAVAAVDKKAARSRRHSVRFRRCYNQEIFRARRLRSRRSSRTCSNSPRAVAPVRRPGRLLLLLLRKPTAAP
jgi:hypothetical protein